jgi:selenocysteine-specific elongation factor
VAVAVLDGAKPLGQRSRVRVHLGTAEVLARVTPADGSVAPGATGVVRLRLEEPLVGRWGDRGVLRAYSPVTTVAGFRVLDPSPPARPRRPMGATGLASDDPAARLPVLIERESARGVSRHDLPVRLGIPQTEADAIVGAAGGAVVEATGRLFPRARLDEACEVLRQVLARHHASAPLEDGAPLAVLRRSVRPASLAAVAEHTLVENGEVIIERAVARLATHRARVPAELDSMAAAVREQLAGAGYEGATPEELVESGGGMDVEALRRLLDFLVRQGTARRIGAQRYYDAATSDRMVGVALEILRETGELGPAQLRDRLGVTRKYIIPFLEWLDAEGLSVRVGDVRRAGPRA